MKKYNFKWRVNSQREGSNIVKSISIESASRIQNQEPLYLIRREIQGKPKRKISNYTKYVFHSNQISPTSSPNTSKLIKQEDLQQTPCFNGIEKKPSMSTISTDMKSTRIRHFKTESIKLQTLHQLTENMLTNECINYEIPKIKQVQVEGEDVKMYKKLFKPTSIFQNRKFNISWKQPKKAQINLIDQVINFVRIIKQPNYKQEINQKQSKIWIDNASFEKIKFQQQYLYSLSQFKIYFSQYFDKHLKLDKIDENNLKNIKIISENQHIQENIEKMRKAQFNNLFSFETKIEKFDCQNSHAIFQTKIETYGMIDFSGDSLQLNDSNIQYEDLIMQEQKIQFPLQLIENNILLETQITNYINPIASQLDSKAKNKLLSVDYTIIDQQIYRDGISDSIPQLDYYFDNKSFRKTYINLYYQNYNDILEGTFHNENHLIDLEIDAPSDNEIEQQQIQITNPPLTPKQSPREIQIPIQLDKKKMLMGLRGTKQIWQSGLVSKLSPPASEVSPSHRATVQIIRHDNDSPLILQNQLSPTYVPPKLGVNQMFKSTKSVHGRNQKQTISEERHIQKDQIKEQTIKENLDNSTQQGAFLNVNMLKSQKSQRSFRSQRSQKSQRSQRSQRSQNSSGSTERMKMSFKLGSESNFGVNLLQSVKLEDGQFDSYLDFLKLQKFHKPQNIVQQEALKQQNLILYDSMIRMNRSKKQIVSLLIEHAMYDEFQEYMEAHQNFNLNATNKEGIPFISIAAASGNIQIVNYILNYNPNLNQVDQYGKVPLHYAMEFKNYHIADILAQHGALQNVKINK